MTPLIVSTLSLRHVGFSLVCLFLGGFCATLFSAYARTGQVGVLRLAEKYPGAKDRLTRWAPRWDLLRTSLLLVSIMTQVGIVAFAVLSLRPAPGRFSLELILVMLVTVLLFTFAFNVLPRALSRTYADRISVMFLPLAAGLSVPLFPLAWPMARLGQALHAAFLVGSDEEDRPSPEDEIRSVVDQASDKDLEHEERQLIHSVFEFGDTVTREIMTPRVEIESLEDTMSVAACVAKVKSSPHSRFPVFHESLDDVRGVIHIKDLLRLLDDGRGKDPVGDAIKETTFAPESMPINDLLSLLRSIQAQLAIVVDEYGGTAGLVTMEDIIEELVGDILDEYDLEENRIQRLSDGSAVLDARTPVDEVNELLGIAVPEADEYDSIGGYVFHELGRVPRPGEHIENAEFRITVQTANPRQIHTLRIQKGQPAPGRDAATP